MIYIMLATITGCLVILSMIINSHLASKIGVLQGTFVNYIVGLLVTTIAILLIQGPSSFLSLSNINSIPFYAFLGGLIGIMVVGTSNVIIPKIPAIYTTLLIFLGQIFTGILIDYFRWNTISKGKIIGGFLIILGLLYNTFLDKNK